MGTGWSLTLRSSLRHACTSGSEQSVAAKRWTASRTKANTRRTTCRERICSARADLVSRAGSVAAERKPNAAAASSSSDGERLLRASAALARAREAEGAQAVDERASRDTELLGGQALIAAALLERIEHTLPLDVGELLAQPRARI